MSTFKIEGGHQLKGSIKPQGAKNEALQILCAVLLTPDLVTIHNIPDIVGDKDPLDICVLTERSITHGDLIVPAIPIGGFRMIDGGEADDKIIAVAPQIISPSN